MINIKAINETVTDVNVSLTKARTSALKKIKRGWQLYLLMVLPFTYILLFKYIPMYGAQIAFRNYRIVDGFFSSPWVGLKHFYSFINAYQFWTVLGNTLGISFYNILVGFPSAIILALSLNYIGNKKVKKIVQMTTYAPHFISVVVIVGIIMQILDARGGIVNNFITLFGGSAINFMGIPQYFKSIFVWSDVWQNVGWSSIIYLAALSGVDPELHDVATVDGASKLKRIRHIDIPSILPTAVILLIMSVGRVLDVGFQKILLMQNPLNMGVSEVIDTYVYNLGIAATMPDYSYASAVGLFKSLIGLILILTVNKISKTISETSLW